MKKEFFPKYSIIVNILFFGNSSGFNIALLIKK